jgi:hypothetical protein
MATYLVPTDGKLDDIIDLATKAGMHIATPTTIREFIIENNENPHGIYAVTTEQLMLLGRHASQLMNEMPSVVFSVPGLVYGADWMTAAGMYHPADWIELTDKLSKTGLIAHTLEDAEKRDRGPLEATYQQSPRSLRDIRKRSTEDQVPLESLEETYADDLPA